MSFTIGSLFDGSGGFPLAASRCGGTPKWASEIEPYPIAVTKSRFPNVKHLGSVTDIKGSEVEPVDVITFGSPCQDLSVAGKRAGLKHEANGDDETTRSGLFMEAVRIIKEMREATNGVYPRFALWENVPGAFSSNQGEDFRIVLQELIQVAEPTAVMPEVPKNGWPYADSYCGDGWSIAYRVLDAQYWGVPQRRRRIYLVADFRGECAGKVSFEREGLRGYFETGRTPWQTVTGDAEGGSGATDCQGIDGYNSTLTGDLSSTLGVNCGMSTGRNGVVVPYTLKIRSGCEGGGKGALVQENLSATLATNNDQYLFQPVMTVLDDQGGSQISVRDDGKCPTLRAEMHGNVPSVMEPMTYDARGNGDGKVASTITGGHESSISDFTSVVIEPVLASGGKVSGCLMASGYEKLGAQEMFSGDYTVIERRPIPIHDQATRFSGKHGDKSDGKGNGLGIGNPGDPMNTLTSGDRHAVAYTMQAIGEYKDCGKASSLKMRDYKDATDLVCIPASFYPQMKAESQCFRQDNTANTLVNGTNPGFQNAVVTAAPGVCVRYIVRRLTPTECARLQGFPDTWGHPIEKTDLTDEEYHFWLNVRNTHAAINDKAIKEYSKDQMLKWYNGLHTDSSEYKMWGNGIALPNALYMMQGIADVMSEEKAARRKWLDDLLGGCL